MSFVIACVALPVGFSHSPAMADEVTFPSSFDLRNVDTDGDGIGDRCYVTSVKNQRPFADCWGFATVAASEISILGSILEDDPEAYKTLDLSEKQLAYFACKSIDDPSSSQNGEGRYPTDTSSSTYDIGGSPILAANILAQGTGLTNESRDAALVYKGKNGKIDTFTYEDKVVELGNYSADDDWSLDESYRFMQDYVLTESHMLPSPAITTDPVTGASVPYQYNPAGTAAIKSELMQKRGVVIGYHTDDFMPVYFNANTFAHYTYEEEASDHAVTIVGWDDNFSAENFPEGHEPPGDGAWLIKNSWGSGTEEFPNTGSGTDGIPVEMRDENGNIVTDENGDPVMVGSGYFWLSYYDKSISNVESFVFETASDSDVSGFDLGSIQTDQYDFMPVTNVFPAPAPDESKQANVFRADEGRMLAGISFFVASQGVNDTQVTYSVYHLGKDFKDPEDGVLMDTGTLTPTYGGYYVQEIEPFYVPAGEAYSVIITQQDSDGNYILNMSMELGKESDLAKSGGTPVYSKAVVNAGESFMYSEGSWKDWASEGIPAMLEDEAADVEGLDPQIDNFAIKGLYVDMDNFLGGIGFAGGIENLVLTEGGDSKTVSLEMLDLEGNPLDLSDLEIEWSVVGDDGIVQIVPSADGVSATVNGTKTGTVRLAAKIEGVKVLFLPVEVKVAEEEPNDPGATDQTESTQGTETTTENHTIRTNDTDHSESHDPTAEPPTPRNGDTTSENIAIRRGAPAWPSTQNTTDCVDSPETGDKITQIWIITAATAAATAITTVIIRKRKSTP